MKVQPNKQNVSGSPKGRTLKLLLVGRDSKLTDRACPRILSGDQLWITSGSASLLGALERLPSEAPDLVLLSGEFREEESSLFAFDAQRRGFTGVILRVVSIPHEVTFATLADNRALPRWYLDQPVWEGEAKRKSSRATERHELSAQRMRPSAQEKLESNDRLAPISFTAKEQAVLMRVSEGWTNQQIAHHLKCSEGSVKAVLQQLFRKLGVRKRAQIVRMAFEQTFFPL